MRALVNVAIGGLAFAACSSSTSMDSDPDAAVATPDAPAMIDC